MIHKNGTYKVLIIEDNPADAELVQLFLEESDLAKFNIEIAATLKKGLSLLKKSEDYDVVLLDLNLPDSSGMETLENLLFHYPLLNVIILTGVGDKSMGIEAVQKGAQDFLIKGHIDAEQLSRSLRYSIERKNILSSLEETRKIAKIGNWEYYPEKEIFNASDEVFRIFGVKAKSYSLQEIGIPDSPLNIFINIFSEIELKKSLQRDIKINLSNGSTRYVNLRCTKKTIYDEIMFHGIVQDISDKRNVEIASKKSQKLYQELFFSSTDAIFIADFEGKFIDFNPATESLFGTDKASLKNENNLYRFFKSAEKSNELLLKIKFTGSVIDFEIQLQREDGSERQCLVSANLREDQKSYNAVFRDITEKKETESLKKARDLARQSANLKEQFIASISHEMRTPMNAIYGMSNLLSQTVLSKDQENLVTSIHHSSEILLGIINDILEMASIQNGKIDFVNEPFNLQELLNSISGVMQYKAGEKDLRIDVRIDADVPVSLTGDKLRLNQILYNLVGNAIKFTDEGFVELLVEKLNDFEGGVHLIFTVRDSGIGIPADKINSVFQSFTRLKHKGRIYEGTGLGLAIVKNLVEQQGGKVKVRSQDGKGSSFSFDLIFEIDEGGNLLEENRQKPREIDPEREYNVLLVEDHKLNQIVAKRTIEKKWENVKIDVAENGSEAVEKVKKKIYDLILMDVLMPVMDGFEATRIIRNDLPKENARIPIIAMTAHANITKQEKYLEMGMNDYVIKPFKPEQLFKKIVLYLSEN